MSSSNKDLRPDVEARLAQQYQQQLTSRDKEHEAKIINEIFDQISEPRKKIPEPVFRDLFLPFFTGERQMTSADDVVPHWAGVVGSHTEPADVVGPQGEVLFTVPPMVDTSQLNTLADRRGPASFGGMFQSYEEQSRLHAKLGVRDLADGLAQKTSEIMPQNRSQYSWDGVLEYYGLKKPSAAATQEAANVNGDDDLVEG